MKKTRRKKRAKKRRVRRRMPRVGKRPAVDLVAPSGQYICITAVSEHIEIPTRIQEAMLGMTFATLSRADSAVKEWVKQFEDAMGIDFDGHVVLTDDVLVELWQRGFTDYVNELTNEYGHSPFFWFPRDACSVKEKKQLN